MATFVFRCPNNTNLTQGFELLLPVQFCRIPFSGCRETKNVSVNQRPRRQCLFSNCPENTNLVEDVEFLLQVS